MTEIEIAEVATGRGVRCNITSPKWTMPSEKPSMCSLDEKNFMKQHSQRELDVSFDRNIWFRVASMNFDCDDLPMAGNWNSDEQYRCDLSPSHRWRLVSGLKRVNVKSSTYIVAGILSPCRGITLIYCSQKPHWFNSGQPVLFVTHF